MERIMLSASDAEAEAIATDATTENLKNLLALVAAATTESKAYEDTKSNAAVNPTEGPTDRILRGYNADDQRNDTGNAHGDGPGSWVVSPVVKRTNDGGNVTARHVDLGNRSGSAVIEASSWSAPRAAQPHAATGSTQAALFTALTGLQLGGPSTRPTAEPVAQSSAFPQENTSVKSYTAASFSSSDLMRARQQPATHDPPAPANDLPFSVAELLDDDDGADWDMKQNGSHRRVFSGDYREPSQRPVHFPLSSYSAMPPTRTSPAKTQSPIANFSPSVVSMGLSGERNLSTPTTQKYNIQHTIHSMTRSPIDEYLYHPSLSSGIHGNTGSGGGITPTPKVSGIMSAGGAAALHSGSGDLEHGDLTSQRQLPSHRIMMDVMSRTPLGVLPEGSSCPTRYDSWDAQRVDHEHMSKVLGSPLDVRFDRGHSAHAVDGFHDPIALEGSHARRLFDNSFTYSHRGADSAGAKAVGLTSIANTFLMSSINHGSSDNIYYAGNDDGTVDAGGSINLGDVGLAEPWRASGTQSAINYGGQNSGTGDGVRRPHSASSQSPFLHMHNAQLHRMSQLQYQHTPQSQRLSPMGASSLGQQSRPMPSLYTPPQVLKGGSAGNQGSTIPSSGNRPGSAGTPLDGSRGHGNSQHYHHGHGSGTPSGPRQYSGYIPPTVSTPSSPMLPSGRISTTSPSSAIRFQLDIHCGHVVELSKDQFGCRALQQALEQFPFESEEVQCIFTELLPCLHKIMSDQYGNFLVQKLLDVATDEARLSITRSVAFHLPRTATTAHGTFTVQKLVESVRTREEEAELCAGLGSDVVMLMTDINGGHVVLKILNCLGRNENQFLYDGICKDLLPICNDRHGCCVVQKCMDVANREQFKQMYRVLRDNTMKLAYDPYGNYVLTHMLDICSTRKEGELLDAVAQHVTPMIRQLCVNKFASNVVEKVLQLCSTPYVTAIVRELLQPATPPAGDGSTWRSNKTPIHKKSDPSKDDSTITPGDDAEMEKKKDQTVLSALAQDQYGNYVVQTALTVAPVQELPPMIVVLKPLIAQLRQHNFAKKMEGKLESAQARVLAYQSGHYGSDAPMQDRASQSTPVGMSTTGVQQSKLGSSLRRNCASTPKQADRLYSGHHGGGSPWDSHNGGQHHQANAYPPSTSAAGHSAVVAAASPSSTSVMTSGTPIQGSSAGGSTWQRGGAGGNGLGGTSPAIAHRKNGASPAIGSNSIGSRTPVRTDEKEVLPSVRRTPPKAQQQQPSSHPYHRQ